MLPKVVATVPIISIKYRGRKVSLDQIWRNKELTDLYWRVVHLKYSDKESILHVTLHPCHEDGTLFSKHEIRVQGRMSPWVITGGDLFYRHIYLRTCDDLPPTLYIGS